MKPNSLINNTTSYDFGVMSISGLVFKWHGFEKKGVLRNGVSSLFCSTFFPMFAMSMNTEEQKLFGFGFVHFKPKQNEDLL